MTMSSSVSKVTLNGDGVQTAWPFSFKVWKAADLEISITNAEGVTTVVSNWSVSLAGQGGTVTYPTSGPALPSGHKITIARSMDFLQDVDLVSGTRWDPEVVETALDIACAERQQLKEKLSRAVTVDIANPTTPDALRDAIFAAKDTAVSSASSALDSAERAEIASSTVAYYNHEGTLLTGESAISLPWAYDTEVGVEVFLGGVKQVESSLIFTDAYTVTLDTPVAADTPFEVVASAGAKGDLAKPSGAGGVGFIADGVGATARTVQAKLRDFISVKDFGAVGDGTTDDTAAIQAAVNFAGGRTTGTAANELLFPVGTYIVSSEISIPQGIVIRGLGNPNTGGVITYGARLKAASSFSGTAIFKNTGADAESWHWSGVESLGFIANGNAIKGLELGEFGETSFVRRCMFDGFTSGIYMAGDQATATLENITANSCTYGIHLYSCNSTVRIFGISGDNNTNLVNIQNGGLSLHVQIFGLKAENYTSGAGDPVVLIDNVSGGFVGIYGGWCDTNGARTQMVLTQKTDAVNNPSVFIVGLEGNGLYTNKYRNAITSKSIPTAGSFHPAIFDCTTFSMGGVLLENGGVLRGRDTGGVYQPLLVAAGGNETQIRPIGSNGTKIQGSGGTNTAIAISQDGLKIGFFGTTPDSARVKPTVTGAKGSNAALASLITALATLGLVTDSTTA